MPRDLSSSSNEIHYVINEVYVLYYHHVFDTGGQPIQVFINLPLSEISDIDDQHSVSSEVRMHLLIAHQGFKWRAWKSDKTNSPILLGMFTLCNLGQLCKSHCISLFHALSSLLERNKAQRVARLAYHSIKGMSAGLSIV